MEFTEVIRKRVSVRGFEEKMIEEKTLDKIISDGNKAPSAGHVYGWEFIKVVGKDTIKALAEATYRGNAIESKEYQTWIESAAAIIVLIYEKESMHKKYGQRGIEKYIYLDGSACMENMLLSAVDSGLGACYVSGCREDVVKDILKIPKNYDLIGFVPVGYYDKKGKLEKQKIEKAPKVHKEHFNR